MMLDLARCNGIYRIRSRQSCLHLVTFDDAFAPSSRQPINYESNPLLTPNRYVAVSPGLLFLPMQRSEK